MGYVYVCNELFLHVNKISQTDFCTLVQRAASFFLMIIQYLVLIGPNLFNQSHINRSGAFLGLLPQMPQQGRLKRVLPVSQAGHPDPRRQRGRTPRGVGEPPSVPASWCRPLVAASHASACVVTWFPPVFLCRLIFHVQWHLPPPT